MGSSSYIVSGFLIPLGLALAAGGCVAEPAAEDTAPRDEATGGGRPGLPRRRSARWIRRRCAGGSRPAILCGPTARRSTARGTSVTAGMATTAFTAATATTAFTVAYGNYGTLRWPWRRRPSRRLHGNSRRVMVAMDEGATGAATSAAAPGSGGSGEPGGEGHFGGGGPSWGAGGGGFHPWAASGAAATSAAPASAVAATSPAPASAARWRRPRRRRRLRRWRRALRRRRARALSGPSLRPLRFLPYLHDVPTNTERPRRRRATRRPTGAPPRAPSSGRSLLLVIVAPGPRSTVFGIWLAIHLRVASPAHAAAVLPALVAALLTREIRRRTRSGATSPSAASCPCPHAVGLVALRRGLAGGRLDPPLPHRAPGRVAIAPVRAAAAGLLLLRVLLRPLPGVLGADLLRLHPRRGLQGRGAWRARPARLRRSAPGLRARSHRPRARPRRPLARPRATTRSWLGPAPAGVLSPRPRPPRRRGRAPPRPPRRLRRRPSPPRRAGPLAADRGRDWLGRVPPDAPRVRLHPVLALVLDAPWPATVSSAAAVAYARAAAERGPRSRRCGPRDTPAPAGAYREGRSAFDAALRCPAGRWATLLMRRIWTAVATSEGPLHRLEHGACRAEPLPLRDGAPGSPGTPWRCGDLPPHGPLARSVRGPSRGSPRRGAPGRRRAAPRSLRARADPEDPPPLAVAAAAPGDGAGRRGGSIGAVRASVARAARRRQFAYDAAMPRPRRPALGIALVLALAGCRTPADVPPPAPSATPPPVTAPSTAAAETAAPAVTSAPGPDQGRTACASACKTQGRCALVDGFCYATSDEACRGSADCLYDGLCYAYEGSCTATSRRGPSRPAASATACAGPPRVAARRPPSRTARSRRAVSRRAAARSPAAPASSA